jgi:hypothetical protein
MTDKIKSLEIIQRTSYSFDVFNEATGDFCKNSNEALLVIARKINEMIQKSEDRSRTGQRER